MLNKKNTSADLQGLTRLITDATIGITDLVEAMHRRVVNPPLLPSTPIQNLITNIAKLISVCFYEPEINLFQRLDALCIMHQLGS